MTPPRPFQPEMRCGNDFPVMTRLPYQLLHYDNDDLQDETPGKINDF